MCTDTASGLTVFGDGLVVGRAADAEGGGEERRDVGDDSHQRAGLGAFIWRRHGDHDVVLVPDVEGVRVGAGEDRGQEQRADPLCLTVFPHVLIYGAKQTVCGGIEVSC